MEPCNCAESPPSLGAWTSEEVSENIGIVGVSRFNTPPLCAGTDDVHGCSATKFPGWGLFAEGLARPALTQAPSDAPGALCIGDRPGCDSDLGADAGPNVGCGCGP